MQARTARQNNLAEAVAALVDDELVPQAMVQSETENRLQDMAMRLQAQGIEFEQYLQFTGQDPQVVMAEMSTQAELTAKVDLALRAIAAQESITATDDELDIELETVAERFDRSVDEVPQRTTRGRPARRRTGRPGEDQDHGLAQRADQPRRRGWPTREPRCARNARRSGSG